jgi:hypothetical protein
MAICVGLLLLPLPPPLLLFQLEHNLACTGYLPCLLPVG